MKRVHNTTTRTVASLPWYHRAMQLILIKSCIVSLQSSTFASTCLEFVIFLRYHAKIFAHPYPHSCMDTSYRTQCTGCPRHKPPIFQWTIMENWLLERIALKIKNIQNSAGGLADVEFRRQILFKWDGCKNQKKCLRISKNGCNFSSFFKSCQLIRYIHQ